jgi:uncharacterized repeat protein (TIGR03803 family)
MKMTKLLLFAVNLMALWMIPPSAHGGIALTTLAAFEGTNGSGPIALVQVANGSFYGTTASGGIGFDGAHGGHGTVFRMTPDGTLTNVVWFDGNNGSYGANLIQCSDGSFYGTTLYGIGTGEDAEYAGTLFKLASDGTMINSNLVAFSRSTRSGSNGANPVALVQGRDGDLYGTTESAGPGGYGTAFKLSADGLFTNLVSFNRNNGSEPVTLVQGADGIFHGTTQHGGASDCGTVFQMTTNGILTSLMSFNGTNGTVPVSLLQGADGSFYGTTRWGGIGFNGSGISGYGTVFKLAPNGTLLWSFLFNGTNGMQPAFLMQGSDGNFYGTTEFGGNGFVTGGAWSSSRGTVFKITPDGAFTNLVLFDGTNGAQPSFMLQDADGNLYGNTQSGGANGHGTVFRLSVPMPPVFRTITPANGVIMFTWSAIARQTYQLQSASELRSTNWSNVGGTIVATNGILSATDSIGTDPQRFYRVVLLP